MITGYLTDNDLYKFTTMNAIQKLYPEAYVKYSFINRGNTAFPDGFGEHLRAEINNMASIQMTREEESFISSRCYYFDPVFIDLLKGFRYNPEEVSISQSGSTLSINIEGLWYRTALWEVPVLAMVSELFYLMNSAEPVDVEKRAAEKAARLAEMEAGYSDFGTRRRFSFDVQDRVISELKKHSGGYFKGTSNVYFAMKHDLLPLGTHPHEWFMFHGAEFGYRSANVKALDAWVEVYKGYLGTALTDTYTTQNFFSGFSTLHAKLFDGLRHDSGDPLSFTDTAIDFYKSRRTDPSTKTIVFSDALDLEKIRKIRRHVNGRINDVYGIGTFLSNDAGHKPLNIVLKMTHSKMKNNDTYHPTVKLSDDTGKHVGEKEEIELCKRILGLGNL
ncbi:MAG TPA: nicotinate phosphoribosyltransferase [Bacteroidales bacterium]|nr:nicotinate phosphoribosyltransferase [Bacteroidales bacterium]